MWPFQCYYESKPRECKRLLEPLTFSLRYSCTLQSVPMSHQDTLKNAWTGGRHGNMSALNQAKAWALREAWRDLKGSDWGVQTYVRKKVVKIGGGPPSESALNQFFAKIDADAEWFPGKSNQEQFGPKPLLNGTNRAIVARSAMAMAERGEEPTYAALIAANPAALMNPEKEEPFSKFVVYNLLREECFDDPDDPDDTWTHDTRHTATALRPEIIEFRFKWGRWMQGLNHQGVWYFKHFIWTDLCSSIIPTTQKRHQEMVLARKGKKGWGSQGTKKDSKHLKGNTSSLKQNSHDSIKVWWAPVLTRGKLHVEILGEGFPGETSAGAEELVAKVRSAVNVRFPGDDQPDIIMVDRGVGFWSPQGQITRRFKAALEEAGFKTFNGDEGWKQPGKLADLLLHETAVAWIRKKETTCRLTTPWTETVPQFGSRLKQVVQEINGSHDVEGLCRQLPKRIQMLIDREGDRLKY